MMKLTKLSLILPLSLSLFSSALYAEILNINNPPQYRQFKTDYAQMWDLANENRLRHRIFYNKPSTGPDSEWFDAVKQGNLAKVKLMVEKGQNIEAKDTGSLNQTALGWAAFIGDEEMVDYLLSENADIWATDKADVHSALKSAVLGKNVKLVDKFFNMVKDKIDINDQKQDSDGETMLMVAASNNRTDIVKYLIEHGADVNLVTTTKNKAQFSYNQNALSYACQRDLKDMQKLLIEHGAINHLTGKASCE